MGAKECTSLQRGLMQRVPIPASLHNHNSSTYARLLQNPISTLAATEGFDLSNETHQKHLVRCLNSCPEWNNLVAAIQAAVRKEPLRPVVIGPGLGIAEDTVVARCLLVALACSVFPEGFCPPYAVGGEAVTQV